MNRLELISRVRANTRDFSNSIFREQDIIDYINEGINRIKQIVPELSGMVLLTTNTQSPIMLPDMYHHLLSVYASARCYAQDERHYQATTLMNEFEVKLDEMHQRVESGQIKIIDPVTNAPVVTENDVDYVDMKPYWNDSNHIDLDDGVEGVE